MFLVVTFITYLISTISAAPFHRSKCVLPLPLSRLSSIHALNLRGGDYEELIFTGSVENDAPIGYGLPEAEPPVDVSIEETPPITMTDNDEPVTVQHRPNVVQPASPDPVESLLGESTEHEPSSIITTPLNFNFISTSLIGAKVALFDATHTYPALKYALIVIVASLVISIFRNLFFEDQKEVEMEEIAVTVVSGMEKPTGNSQVLLSVLIGGLGLAAGSLAMTTEHVENVSSRRRAKAGAPVQDQDLGDEGDDGDETNNPLKKIPNIGIYKSIGVCAGAAWLGSGMAGRATVIKNILGGMF